MRLKCALDLDGTVFNFENHYINKFGNPEHDLDITKHVMNELRKDKEFWLTQPLLDKPNFEVSSYITARVIPKDWIKEQLIVNDLPKAPIYQVFGVKLSKYPQYKRSGCDVLIEDSISNFIELNLKGCPTLLIDRPNNCNWDFPFGRIHSLDYEEIEDVYHLFMNTVFNNFKELL